MRDRFRCGGVSVVPSEGRLVGPRKEVHLRPKTMDVLVALAERQDGIASQREILAEVWGGSEVSDAVLTNAIAELRRGLADVGGDRSLVATVSRRGYRLTAPVAFDAPRPAAARSVAVLPLEDLTPGGADPKLLAAIQEALVGELARHPALRVLSRDATAHCRSGDESLADVGRRLRVARLVTGSAIRNGRRLRLNAQLADLDADRVRWSTSLVVALGDPVELPAALARAVAQELGRALDLPETPARSAAPVLDPRSSERFLRGQLRLRGSTIASLEQRLADLDEVARRRPELATAHASRARGFFLLASWRGDVGGERLARAEASASRALDLEPESTEGQVWWWMARAWGGSRPADAILPLARIVRAHPHDPEARDALAHCLAAVGRLDEAIAEGRRALDDDPLSPSLRAALGFFLRAAGRLAEAAAVLVEALELHPDWTIARLELGRVRRAEGNLELAATEIERAEPAWGRFLRAVAAGDAPRIRRRLELWRTDPDVAPYWLAERALWAGDAQIALESLERARREGQLRVLFAGIEPTFAPLRRRARFRRLIADLGATSAPA